VTAVLHAIADRNLSDIPAKLRRLADRIDSGECEAVRCVVVVRTLDGPQVLGLGASANATQCFEDLHLGAAHLLDMLKTGEAS
jgi:hypothetical protein